MPESTVTITLPEVTSPDIVTETSAGKIVVPGHAIPAKHVTVEVETIRHLIDAARAAASNAYAPYSNFHVGAAVIMADDASQHIITGSNTENSSYGATVCGERSALFRATSLGFRQLRYLALSTADSLASPLQDRSPCGICRQTIREFISRNQPTANEPLILIDTGDEDTLCEVLDIERLLPFGFSFAPTGS